MSTSLSSKPGNSVSISTDWSLSLTFIRGAVLWELLPGEKPPKLIKHVVISLFRAERNDLFVSKDDGKGHKQK